MIIDLDEPLVVIDNRTHAHEVRFIDFKKKLIYCDALPTDDEDLIRTIKVTVPARTTENPSSTPKTTTYSVRVFRFGVNDLTVTTKEINLTDDTMNLSTPIYTND